VRFTRTVGRRRLLGGDIVMGGATSSDLDMLKTQIGNLDIYASELHHLEEWDRPDDRRERALRN
jgi:hypothetical protein